MQVDDPTHHLISRLRRAIAATRGDLATIRAACHRRDELAALDDVDVSLDALGTLVDRVASFASLDALSTAPLDARPAQVACAAMIDRATPLARLREVTLRGPTSWPDAQVIDRGGALPLLLDALLQQAVLHAPRGSRVHVTAAREGDRLAVMVRDAGAPVQGFDAWSSLDAQLEARASPGVRKLGGLGLYLLTRWCDALGATRAQSLTEGRPSLTVRLPIR